jgi:hypothetical protein
MAEEQVQDEVVNERSAAPRSPGRAARAVYEEGVDANTGVSKPTSGGADEDTHVAGRAGRKFSPAVEAMLAKIDTEADDDDAPAPHEEGDADEDEEAAAAAEGADEADEGDGDEGEEEGEGEEAAEPDESEQVRAGAARLEQRNRELVAELEQARKTPKAQRTERETALIAAEASYIDEGPVAGLRKYLSVITGAAPDSKEVTAELTGLYLDLTAQEVGVPLDQSQQAIRENARTRLLLARDKREKAESEKKPVESNSADDVQYEAATRHVDNLLGTKSQSGTSIADDYPMLMSLAQDFDGVAPGEVLARAIRQEIMTGALDPTTPDADMVRTVASKIENHYDAVAKKIEAARAKKAQKAKKSDTTTPSGKPKVKVEAANETRNTSQARTITTATASRAPAKPPKVTKQKAPTTERSRNDFKSDAEWRKYLLNKHFES